jgi:hypothetical protein
MATRKKTQIQAPIGYHVACVWLEVCGGPARKTLTGAIPLNTVQRLMRRHIGTEVLESTFVQAARDTGFLVDMREHMSRAPVIGVSRLAMRRVEQDCERRMRAVGGYASTALACCSEPSV